MAEKGVDKALRLAATRNNRVEIVMKDNHTLGKNPANLTRWTEIAHEEIERLDQSINTGHLARSIELPDDFSPMVL